MNIKKTASYSYHCQDSYCASPTILSILSWSRASSHTGKMPRTYQMLSLLKARLHISITLTKKDYINFICCHACCYWSPARLRFPVTQKRVLRPATTLPATLRMYGELNFNRYQAFQNWSHAVWGFSVTQSCALLPGLTSSIILDVNLYWS